MPSGKIIEKYHQLDYPKEAVVVVIKNDGSEVCFIKSLRYSTHSIEWELPAGGIDEGENPCDAAQREVREETGYEIDNLELVQFYHPSNGMSNQVIHVVFADLQGESSSEFDRDEVDSVHWIHVQDAYSMVQQGKIKDGLSLVALLYLNLTNNW